MKTITEKSWRTEAWMRSRFWRNSSSAQSDWLLVHHLFDCALLSSVQYNESQKHKTCLIHSHWEFYGNKYSQSVDRWYYVCLQRVFFLPLNGSSVRRLEADHFGTQWEWQWMRVLLDFQRVFCVLLAMNPGSITYLTLVNIVNVSCANIRAYKHTNIGNLYNIHYVQHILWQRNSTNSTNDSLTTQKCQGISKPAWLKSLQPILIIRIISVRRY